MIERALREEAEAGFPAEEADPELRAASVK
jgi:hypothetical protein